MPEFTKTLNLEKPLRGEFYAIEKHNENSDKIDLAIEKITVPTIEHLKNMMELQVGDIVEIQGYSEAGDGAHHKRKIASEDDGSGVQLSNGLWANIVHNGEVNVSWFGAKGDGVTDDTLAIQKTFLLKQDVKFSSGVFLVAGSVNTYGANVTGNEKTTIKLVGDFDFFKIPRKSEFGAYRKSFTFRNITFESDANTRGESYVFKFTGSQNDFIVGANFIDLNFSGFNNVFFVTNAFRTNFVRLGFSYTGNPFVLEGTVVQTLIDSCNSNIDTEDFLPSVKKTGIKASIGCENLKIKNTSFVQYDVGINIEHCLHLVVDSCDLDFIKELGFYASGYGIKLANTWISAKSERCECIVFSSEGLENRSFFCSSNTINSSSKNVLGIKIKGSDDIMATGITIDSNYFLGEEESYSVGIFLDRVYNASITNNNFKNRNSCANASIKGDYVKNITCVNNSGGNIAFSVFGENGVVCHSNIMDKGISIITDSNSVNNTIQHIKELQKITYNDPSGVSPGTDGQILVSPHLNTMYLAVNGQWIQYYRPTSQIDTPYYTLKMQQEGIYDDYITYRDELHEYEQSQKQAVEGVAMMNELVEPQPSQALLDFKKKYLG